MHFEVLVKQRAVNEHLPTESTVNLALLVLTFDQILTEFVCGHLMSYFQMKMNFFVGRKNDDSFLGGAHDALEVLARFVEYVVVTQYL